MVGSLFTDHRPVCYPVTCSTDCFLDIPLAARKKKSTRQTNTNRLSVLLSSSLAATSCARLWVFFRPLIGQPPCVFVVDKKDRHAADHEMSGRLLGGSQENKGRLTDRTFPGTKDDERAAGSLLGCLVNGPGMCR